MVHPKCFRSNSKLANQGDRDMADRIQQQIDELVRQIRKIMDEGNKRAERQQIIVEELQKTIAKVRKVKPKNDYTKTHRKLMSLSIHGSPSKIGSDRRRNVIEFAGIRDGSSLTAASNSSPKRINHRYLCRAFHSARAGCFSVWEII